MLEQEIKQKKCIHHWIIGSSDGETSSGRCMHCGEVKEFANNWDITFIKKASSVDSDSTPLEI